MVYHTPKSKLTFLYPWRIFLNYRSIILSWANCFVLQPSNHYINKQILLTSSLLSHTTSNENIKSPAAQLTIFHIALAYIILSLKRKENLGVDEQLLHHCRYYFNVPVNSNLQASRNATGKYTLISIYHTKYNFYIK